MTTRSLFSWRALRQAAIAVTAGLTLGTAWIASAANLGDQPVFVTNGVPGNLALALSVEYPTATRNAHTDDYSNTATFLGYFDPNKCYTYVVNTAVDSTGQADLSYFKPVAKTTNGYRCQGQWSGNFLNWATMSTIDPFRWALTGGRRISDTATETIIQKGWNSGQGGLFPDRTLTPSEVPLVTPYSTVSVFNVYVGYRGFKLQIAATGSGLNSQRVLSANYYNNKTFSGPVAATVANDSGDHLWGGVSPVAGVNSTYFSAIYTSTFTTPSSGFYYFATYSDDTIEVFINGSRVISNTFDHAGSYDYSGGIFLLSGQQVSLRAQYTQSGGDSAFQLFWYKPGDSAYSIYTSGSRSDVYTVSTKVCDASLGTDYLESNCQRYGTAGNYTYKPEGLIQQYSQKMRFSAFGYLNDSSDQRDGGVMRAAQKFVGPTAPVPGQAAITNTEAEWSSTTGIQVTNPNAADAATTTAAVNNAVTISNSGVINYLNKFGQLQPGNYKAIDPVSELYYAVLRYYKNLGNIASWSNMGTTDPGTIATYLDGFPVITNWTQGTTARPDPDPIQYSCQRNFILGIGDIYTHVDKNLPGNTQYLYREPAAPNWTTETVNVVTATNKVGNLQGVGNIGSTNDYSGRNNSAYIAGLAYDANTVDIRPDVASVSKTIGKQTVQTYWVDVLEASFQANNQFYLAAKFGGLKVPDGFDPYNFTGNIPQTWWSTSGDTLTDVRTNTTQPRPDNYFTAGRPDLMVSGLRTAFASIAAGITNAFTSALSLSTPQVSSTGTASYSAQYNAAGWSGTVTGNTLTFAADGTPSSTVQWSSDTTLTAQAAGTGWDTARRIASWNGTAGVPFRTTSPGLTDAQENTLQTTYVATGVDDRNNYLNYLRGDRTNERTDTDATKPYRKRTQLLGDIVDAKLTTVGAPSLSYSNSVNPGYSTFKTQKASRPTMVYAAANDGMLHAFNATTTTTTGNAGTEQFAYVPSALFSGPSTPATPAVNGLAQLGNPNYVHRYYVNATPLVFDIDFANIGPFATAAPPATTPMPNWRSVLIGGLGKGGKSFYALDVTDPGTISSESVLSTKVLWEFSDTDMGYSYGAPVVVKTKKYGWVVVLTSGYTDTNANTPGYLYFVNPATGALLEKVSTGTGTVSHGLTQASAYIQDFTDNTADAIYVGDLDGQLWRFDVTAARASTGNYPAPAKLAIATDASGTAQPITTQPLIEISPSTKKRYVLFGTGRLLDASDVATSGGQSFYAIIDGTTPAFAAAPATPYTRSALTAVIDLTTGVTLSSTSPGWYTDLGSVNGIGLRVLLNPTAYNGTVAFSSLQTNADACNPNGASRLYAVDFATGKTQLDSGAAYTQYSSAIVDQKFVQVDGKVRLVTTDATGARRQEPLKPPATTPLRLTNWREIPTAD